MSLTDEQQKILQRRKLAKIKDYRKIFGTEEGKRVLYDLMNSCFVLHGSFDSDPYRTAYNEGQRAAVWKILHHLNTDERQLAKILKERTSYEYPTD